MTPVEELRKAAALLRETAALAPNSPYTPSQADLCGTCGHTRSVHDGLPRIGENRTGCTGPFLAECGTRCAAFVDSTTAEVLMSPPVALALANLFDKWAWMGRIDPDFVYRVGGDEILAVARQVFEGEKP